MALNNIINLFRDDMKRLFSNVVSSIIAIGLILIPSIFAWYNVIACWDVFGNTGNLKVAVANSDSGYESDLLPLKVNVGEEVVSALRANDEIDWTFTTEEDAVDGAKSGRYYAAVVIPESFSRDMLTFYSDDMQHGQIIYYTNEKKNAIAPKITDRGADTVSYQVNKAFTETISNISLGIIDSLSKYMDEADVDSTISTLSSHVRSVADQMDRASSVLILYSSLSESAQSLIADSANLVSAAQQEVSTLADTAQDGAATAKDALDAVQGAAQDLSTALDASKDAFAGVESDVDALFDNAGAMSGNAIANMRSQASSLDAQVSSYEGIIAQLDKLHGIIPPSYEPALDGVIQAMESNVELMKGISSSLRTAADKLESGNADIEEQRAAIKALVSQAAQGVADVKADYDTNLKPRLQELAGEVQGFSDGLGAGVAGLGAMADDLTGSAASASGLLGDASGQIVSGSGKLSDVSSTLHSLADKIDAALASGDMDKIREILGSDVSSLATALSAPVGVDRIAVYPVENFGSAMAPLYTTLALFIGSLLILVAVKPGVSEKVQAKLKNPKPRELFLGRFGVMSVLSFAQTTVMGLGNMFFLQVQVAHPILFMLLFWFAGQVFTFLIYSLVASFANLGKAMSVLLLIVQVTGCGGSYPLQILPQFVQDLSAYLPATHVVAAMRSAMMGSFGNDFWIHMGMLALFLIPAALIGLVLRRVFEKFMHWYIAQVEASKLIE